MRGTHTHQQDQEWLADSSAETARDRRLALACLIAAVVFAGAVGMDRAARRPFWFDEILTIAVSTQPTIADVWKALGTGLDHNPPLFHLIEHAAARLPVDRHVAFRLPSILAFCLTIVALFLFTSRASGRALSGAAAAWLAISTQLFTVYAVESRPYALIACAVAWAAVMWQQAHLGLRYGLACGMLLMAATSMHYYAVLGVVPLAGAELIRWLRTREFRTTLWSSFLLTALPLVVFWPLMSRIRADFAAHFWARPPLVGFLRTYDAFLNSSNWWGVAVVCGVGAALAASLFRTLRSDRSTWGPSVEPRALVLVLLILPPITFAAARIMGVGVTARYLIPTAIGVVIGIALVAARHRTATLLVGAIAFCVVVTRGLEEQYLRAPLADQAVARDLSNLSRIAGEAHYRDVPIAVTNGLAFLPLVFYNSSTDLRLFYATDSQAAIALAGTDTTELLLQRATPLLRLPVRSLDSLTGSSDRFLLYGGNEIWDWLPATLLQHGFRIELVSRTGVNSLYVAERATGSATQ